MEQFGLKIVSVVNITRLWGEGGADNWTARRIARYKSSIAICLYCRFWICFVNSVGSYNREFIKKNYYLWTCPQTGGGRDTTHFPHHFLQTRKDVKHSET